MSEDNNKNEEFDKFLNKKEQEGGAFEKSNKEEAPKSKQVEDVEAIEKTIEKKGLGSVNMSNYGQDKA